MVSVAAVLDVANGRIRSARLAFGGLAHQPWRVAAAEALLAGSSVSDVSAQAAADAVLAGARGHGHNDFKIPLVRRTLRTVLVEV